MFRNAFIVLIAILCFGIISSYLGSRMTNPTGVVVELEVRLVENDIFYVYYLPQGITKWDDKHSVYHRVKGAHGIQKLRFDLPIDQPIQKIRIDLGANKAQVPIIINSVVLKSETGSFVFKDNLTQFFDLNQYIEYKEERYNPIILNNRYDPFMVSTIETDQKLKLLGNSQLTLNIAFNYLLSSIFALTIAIFLFKIEWSLSTIEMAIGTFFVLLFLPVSVLLFDEGNSRPNLEKRQLAIFPDLHPVTTFPGKFEDYFNDNFGLRNYMIEASSKMKINIFHSSPKPELVQFGKNGYLFYNRLEDEIYASYTNTNLLDMTSIENLYQKLAKRRMLLAEKGIEYICGFWPNKHTLYTENLPSSMAAQIRGNFSLADQMTGYFQEKGFAFFDVRKDLFKEKNKVGLFRKLDTHWNNDGAYLAYLSFCEQTKSVIGLKPVSLDKFRITYTDTKEGDLTQMLGVTSILGLSDRLPSYSPKDRSIGFETSTGTGTLEGAIITRNRNCGNNLKVLIFRDSFTTALIQFLSLHFSEVIYIDGTYNESLLEQVAPNIVISCRAERYLMAL